MEVWCPVVRALGLQKLVPGCEAHPSASLPPGVRDHEHATSTTCVYYSPTPPHDSFRMGATYMSLGNGDCKCAFDLDTSPHCKHANEPDPP